MQENTTKGRKVNIMLQLAINNAPVYIRKKNGTLEDYNADKIDIAIHKSATRCLTPLTDDETAEVIAMVENRLTMMTDNIIAVERIHNLVEASLKEVRPDVAESYINYRNVRKKFAQILERVFDKTNSLLFLGDRQNSNSDSKLSSTIGCAMSDYLGTELYEESFLLPKERQAAEDGAIYIHDKSKRYTMPFNCVLFNLTEVLSGGFEMNNTFYNEPKTLDTAFDVLGDVILSGASQQYGGFTITEADKILAPYAEKSYQKYLAKYLSLGIEQALAEKTAESDTLREMEQGFQGWEYKFNTVASSRGDYPFITCTFGLQTDKWGKNLSLAILKVRKEGQGKPGHKKPVLFPKLVFLYDENLHGPGKELEDVFEMGIECSSKTMYPDWLSLTGEGYVPSIYKKYGLAISPMGCRAFLSPWYEKGGMEPYDETDKPVFVGRFNIGVVSLNLPLIYESSIREGKDFFTLLDYYLQMIRNIHQRTYDWIAQMPVVRNPLAFCEGGILGGHLPYDAKIGSEILKSATASFGITALNELQQCYNGKSLVEDGAFALEVMEYINKRVQEFKKEDGHLYAIYGTPAETLCGKQVTQFRKKYGIKKGVSDREYVSNSFHCHVTENISPIQKQNLENRFWDLFNGGKIQYVKYNVGYNLEAIRTLVRRAMDMGFYEGVNLALSFCDDCGHQAIDIGDECPVCGSHNLTKIDRMNGYLSYSRIKGDTRLNAAKMAEIKERISM